MSNSRKFKLLGTSGSIRKGSFNSAFLEALMARVEASGKADCTIFHLGEIPLYNQDVENAGFPASVQALRHAVTEADGFVISTPEYNHGMSGVLKNALDWISRPAFESPLKDKPCLPLSTSAATNGGIRAHTQIHETLYSTLARVVARREVAVASVYMKVKDGIFVDEDNLSFAEAAIDDLIAEIRSVQK